ncbi:MAG: ATP-binding cassette domain-containing protein [Actinomycetota bacterium]|nr:ATP-binding cassette domain-containing protein [Actinomycetota bacterium]
MSTALSVRGLSAGYGPLQVLDGIDLDVAEQERVGLVGLNGHGKSTLMRAIVGLVDWRTGAIESGGLDLMKTPTYRLARDGIVLIPQGDSLFPGLSVRDNLDAGAYAPANWRRRAESRERVVEIFPRLGERMKQIVGTLSGGERRMCSIARGLMAEAHIYLVDEPSLGLAPGIAETIVRTLCDLDLGGGALVLAEQNRTLVEGRIDRIVRIHAGKVASIEPGTPAQEPA